MAYGADVPCILWLRYAYRPPSSIGMGGLYAFKFQAVASTLDVQECVS